MLGLMSGTSCDGIAAAVVEKTASKPRVVARASFPFSAATRRWLLELPRAPAPALCEANVAIGELFAGAARRMSKGCALVGSHGQTVWHDPGRASLQLGDAAVIARACGLPVVSDFRAADIAAGGQGAPLVPFADRMFFAKRGRSVAVINIGGIANVTWLGADGKVVAFDTGPGNCLIDAAARRFLRKPIDRNGAAARKGLADDRWIFDAMKLPYFDQPPPKSTGRELFADSLVPTAGKGADVLATLTQFTARSIREQIHFWCGGPDEVLVGGGGSRNAFLMHALREALNVEIRPTDAAGVPWDAREAAAFALLAWAFERRIPGNIATGGKPAVLGKLSLP